MTARFRAWVVWLNPTCPTLPNLYPNLDSASPRAKPNLPNLFAFARI